MSTRKVVLFKDEGERDGEPLGKVSVCMVDERGFLLDPLVEYDPERIEEPVDWMTLQQARRYAQGLKLEVITA